MELDTRQDTNALEYLISQQYWREQKDDDVIQDYNRVDESILYHPLLLNSALYSHMKKKKHIKLLNEADVIREVLFLLKGGEGVLFKYDENQDHFILDETYMVRHLSQHSLSLLLNEFCVYGNRMSDLRVIATRIANRIQFGQTSQAFATAVTKLLADFEYQISKLETDNRFTTSDPSNIISILKLRNTLDPALQVFGEIHSIAIGIPFDHQMNACSYLISVIYERTLIAQSSEQLHIYTHLLDVFVQTMAPIGRMMDDWIFYGNLEIDKANEFYVKRQLGIHMDEMDFWKKGYFLSQVERTEGCFKCPLFDGHVMERVFFTGKAINLLTRMNKLPRNVESIEVLSDDGVELITSDVEDGDAEQIKVYHQEAENNAPERKDIKHDALTRALFPLLNPSMNKTKDKNMEPSTIGLLFDQVFIQAVEEYIEKPYHQVANHLNKVLHQECALDQQLKTLASVYLLLGNDLMHSFCESLFIQMDKNANWFGEIILNRIYLEASELSGYKDIVYIHIDDENSSEAKNMTSCLSLIRFNVQINWPLNYFVQPSNLVEYTKINGFLMRLKRSKYVLEKRTLFGSEKRSRSDRNTMRFYSIRIKMLWFVNAFWGYIMTTILHAETLKFYDNLSKSKDADEITALHRDYVRRIVDYCLLNNKSVSIKKAIFQIMDLTERMGDLFKRFMISKEHDDTIFNDELDIIEKEFDSANKFITASLNILVRMANLPWRK
ncbi:hypothetical protein K501DRAFT_257290 [Backusella circina FSU 941]|nr:hypothetical protein K501DRAFT_257290 [Backusella circina FSU 941]